jgi:hypothetical protein
MNEQVLKNPITARIINAVNSSSYKLNFAVPFLNSFTHTILNESNTKNVVNKRIVTRFDETCLISYDLPTLQSLLDLGFEIRYENEIHLKLYITDSETFVTSSNLTKGGFEDNIELTIRVDDSNAVQCNEVFDELWKNTAGNEITKQLIKESWPKYLILKKRESYNTRKSNITVIKQQVELNIETIINAIFNIPTDYTKAKQRTFQANVAREAFKSKLKNGYNKYLFYAEPNHSGRRENLFYDLSYGIEEKIASTGLRELQFKTVFQNDQFKDAVEYIFPEMVGMKPWNFEYDSELKEFCIGIFEYRIPQYSEALPIRLASYFYPEVFLPIFNLQHLKQICEAYDIVTDAKTKGERLYAYTISTRDKMKPLLHDNSIKSNIAYNVMFTIEVYNRLKNGETFEHIRSSHKQNWKKEYLDFGLEILKKLKYVN